MAASTIVTARWVVSCLITCYIAITFYSAYQTTTIVDQNVLAQPLADSKASFRLNNNRPFPQVGSSSLQDSQNTLPEQLKQQHPEKKIVKKKTLALLYPPGMIGGYRNQVLRFMAFVSYAQKHSMDSLFVPSILWSTQYKEQHSPQFKASFNTFYPIPMDTMFDIEHWNTYSPTHLPRLVYDLQDEGDGHVQTCWIGKTDHHNDNDRDDNSSKYFLRRRRNDNGNQDIIPASDTTNRDEISSNSTYLVSPMVDLFAETKPFLTEQLGNISQTMLQGQTQINPRKIDYLQNVSNCTNPYVYGGGKGAGRLWNDYLSLPKQIPGQKSGASRNTNASNPPKLTEKEKQAQETSYLMQWMSRALIPAKQWRNVARECIVSQQRRQEQSRRRLSTQTDRRQLQIDEKLEQEEWPSYVALHARVEVDMMIHKCGRNMEKNLTKIINMVNDFVSDYNAKEQEQLKGVFVAVSRSGMQQPPNKDTRIQQLAKDNWQILTERSSSNHLDRTYYGRGVGNTSTTFRTPDSSSSKTPPLLVECGELWMDKWYNDTQHIIEDDYYGSLLPSMMNFYLATEATVFVGVAKSSWSNDVWTTRYYQGKGHTNFEYTTDAGLRQLPNGGLPPPHKNC